MSCAGQFGLIQRSATSSSNRTTSLPQAGHSVGIWNSCSSPFRFSSTTRTTFGMISPAFLITTVSPIRISCSRIKSSLCSEARCTVDPATFTGSRIAVGVITPVLPILSSISRSFVMASSAGNL